MRFVCILFCLCLGFYGCVNLAPKAPQVSESKTTKPNPPIAKQPTESTPTKDSQITILESQKDTPKAKQYKRNSGILKFDFSEITAEFGDSLEPYSKIDNYTGTIRLHHDNGNIAWEIDFKNGKQDGWSRWFYTNGALRTEMFFVGGDANGDYRWFYRNGVLREEGAYENDLAQGTYKLYAPNGKLEALITYRDGEEISRRIQTQ